VSVCSAGVTTMVSLPSSAGPRLLAGGGDGTVTVLSGPTPVDLREERQIHLDGKLNSLSLSADASEALAVSDVGTTFRIRCQDLLLKVEDQVAPGALYDVAYLSGISELFLTCCSDGNVTLWDANDYSARVRCPTRSRAYPISVAGSSMVLVAGCSDGRLLAFDCARGEPLWNIDNAHKGGATSVQLASSSRFVVTGGAEGDVRVWEFRTREMAAHLKEHGARVNEVRLFPSDQYAISAGRDRCLLTWDLATEKRLTCHREKHGGINCLALASNQTTVITAGQEKTMVYWDLRMADPVRSINLDEEVYGLSLSPDDRYLATCGTGLLVKIWDVAAGTEKSRGSGHSRAIQKLAFSPDGKQVVSAGMDHSILVWNCYT